MLLTDCKGDLQNIINLNWYIDITMSGKYFVATDTNFQAEILDSGKVALVDFWAAWCGPCLALAPVIDQLASDYDGKAVIAKVNVDDNPNTAAKYGIRSIPSLLIFKNGEVVDQMLGALPKNKIAEKLDAYLG